MMSYGGEKEFDDIFSRLDTTHECDDGQTDGRTDTGRQHIPRLCIVCLDYAKHSFSCRQCYIWKDREIGL